MVEYAIHSLSKFRFESVQLLLFSFSLPYLDQHGEPDPGLKRGNQLLLSESAYENIRKQWIGHEFAERVSRAQSSNRHYYGNNQWDQF